MFRLLAYLAVAIGGSACTHPIDEFRVLNDPQVDARADTATSVVPEASLPETSTADAGKADASDAMATCSPPLVRCSTGCIDVDNDDRNCGKCDDPCTGGRSCRGGKCK